MSSSYSYEFDGDNIVEVTRSENLRVPASKVLAELMKRFQNEEEPDGTKIIERTPILPINCRFYWRDGRNENYIVEVKPGLFPFKWASWYNEDYGVDVEGDEIENVSMPWQYFVFRFIREETPNPYNIEAQFESVKLFWANKRIETINDYVYRALVPNLGGDNAVCLGDVYPDSNEPTWKRIEETVANFYESYFNADLGWEVPYNWSWEGNLEAAVDMIHKWKRMSDANRLCWQDWDLSYLQTERFSTWLSYAPTPSNPETITPDSNLYGIMYDAVRRSRPVW